MIKKNSQILVPHLSITRHSLAYRNSDMAIKQKELLKRASLNDSSFGSSIAVHLDDTKSFANVPSSNVNA